MLIVLEKKKSSIFLYLATFIVLLLLILFINPENLIDKFFQIGLWGIILLVIFYIIDLIVRTYRWKLLLIAQGTHLPLSSLILPVCSALAINLFTIARAGETVRIVSLKRNNDVKYSDSISSIVIEQVLSIIGLLIVVTGSLFFISFSFQTEESSKTVGQLILLLLLISGGGLLLIGIILMKPSFVYKLLNFFPEFLKDKLTSAFEAFIRGLTDLRTQPSLLFQAILTSAAIWTIEGIMLHIIALSIFPSFTLTDLPWVIAASCVGNITFIIPILPGAMGEYEAAIALVLNYSPNYVDPDPLKVASVPFIDRVVKSLILGIVGGYATLQLGGAELLKYRRDYTKLNKTEEL
ncbi:hypothetical protein CEE45_05090 [Candidatus Heimdallarchaeota archaeon B3_Heim]|nr:MAG: hypothetical protein CEE45_05090 [Candidatus Heimdallarchaeota archaeon B3_Heim]